MRPWSPSIIFLTTECKGLHYFFKEEIMNRYSIRTIAQKGLCFSSLLFLIMGCMVFFSPLQAQESTGTNVDDFWKGFFQGYPLPEPAFQLKYPGESGIFLDYSQY